MRTTANRMLGITVAIVIVIAVVVGVVTATQAPSPLDPTTPEGTVQQYFTAVFEHRNDEAAAYLDPSGECGVDDLDRSGFNQDARIDLVSSDVSGDSARVTVRLDYSAGDIFSDGWTEERTLRLSRASGQWKLTGIPWPMYDCNGVVVK